MLAIPFYIAFVWAPDWQHALAYLIGPTLLNYFYLSASVTLVQQEVRPDQRVMSGALLLLIMNMIGLGLGPTYVGAASDFFRAYSPDHSLQMALYTLAWREAHPADRVRAAKEIAQRLKSFVVLKGNGSVLANPGGDWWINHSGNPGMASGGMGDTLTGLITSLLAQGVEADVSMRAGVYVHGAAADRAVATGAGPIGLTAGELIDHARALVNRT